MTCLMLTTRTRNFIFIPLLILTLASVALVAAQSQWLEAYREPARRLIAEATSSSLPGTGWQSSATPSATV